MTEAGVRVLIVDDERSRGVVGRGRLPRDRVKSDQIPIRLVLGRCAAADRRGRRPLRGVEPVVGGKGPPHVPDVERDRTYRRRRPVHDPGQPTATRAWSQGGSRKDQGRRAGRRGRARELSLAAINLDLALGGCVRSHPYRHGFLAAFDHISPDEWEQLARVLDAGIDDLSADQQALAVERASRRVGVAELDARNEQHLRILWDELRAATLRALLDRLVAKRELEVEGVADSGHLLYRHPPGTQRP